MNPCPHCGLPHAGACGASALPPPEILSTAYREIKEKIGYTRLTKTRLDDWAYRGAIGGAIGGVLLVYMLDLVDVFRDQGLAPLVPPTTSEKLGRLLVQILLTTPPAIFLGGLIGVVVGSLAFALVRADEKSRLPGT